MSTASSKTFSGANRGSGVPGGVVWGVQTPPPRNSEDIGGVLDRTIKKNRRLDFLL